MNNIIKIWLICILPFTSYGQINETGIKIKLNSGLTREETVKNTPYRLLDIKDSDKDSIRKDVLEIFNQHKDEILSSEKVVLGFKKMENGSFIKLDYKFNTPKELKEYLNELWRKKDFIETIAVFYSNSRDAQSEKIQRILVFDIENEDYTGTCTAFFDLPIKVNNLIKNFELEYYERN